jgi:hypothetical protein
VTQQVQVAQALAHPLPVGAEAQGAGGLLVPTFQSLLVPFADLLRDLLLFDVYVGENIDSGRKSLALGLILQASSQTLTDESVDEAVALVLDRLKSELGARLRD